MKSYAERNIFSIEVIDLWKYATTLVSRVADTYGNELRCHELARAVWHTLGRARELTVVVDGKLGIIEHSWLQGKSENFILDVYTPGAVPQVVLIHDSPFVPQGHHYTVGPMRDDINGNLVFDLIEQMREAQPVPTCECDLRDAQWDPQTHKCRRCGGLSWARRDKK